jgi:hypothetical protein
MNVDEFCNVKTEKLISNVFRRSNTSGRFLKQGSLQSPLFEQIPRNLCTLATKLHGFQCNEPNTENHLVVTL